MTSYVVIFLLLWATMGAGVEVVDTRCQHPARDSCFLEAQSGAIRCDLTNVTRIPDPTEVEASAPPEVSPYLFVNQSCIHTINTETLAKYSYLIFLDLCGNYISVLQGGAFGKSKTLEKLFIAGNEIIQVHVNAFNGLTALTHLHLGNNRLTTIFGKSLRVLGGTLRVLKLNNNFFESVHQSTFADLRKLEVLDLSGNRFHNILPEYLKGLGNLKVLHLQGNNLLSFHKDVFLAASSIEEVDLCNNSISCLDDDVFENQKLSVIKLSGNPLKTPKRSWIHAAKEHGGQMEITEDGNWVCDCKAYLYQIYLNHDALSQDEKIRYDVRCSFPKPLSGRMLSTVEWMDLAQNSNCSNPEESLKCIVAMEVPPPPAVRTIATTTTPPATTTTPTSTISRITSTIPVIIATFASPRNSGSYGNAALTPSHNHSPFGFAWKEEYTYIAIGVGVLIAIIFILVIFICKRRNNKEKRGSSNNGSTAGSPSLSSVPEALQARLGDRDHSRLDSVEIPRRVPLRGPRTLTETSYASSGQSGMECNRCRARLSQRMSGCSFGHTETHPKAVDDHPTPDDPTIPGYLNNFSARAPSSHIYASMTSMNARRCSNPSWSSQTSPEQNGVAQEPQSLGYGGAQESQITQRQTPLGSSQEQVMHSVSQPFLQAFAYPINPQLPHTLVPVYPAFHPQQPIPVMSGHFNQGT